MGCDATSLPREAFCATHLKDGCSSGSPLSGWEPRYDPGSWNNHTEITDSHNCFSYAMNVNDPRQIRPCIGKKYCDSPFHQPGAAAGYRGFKAKKPKTCPNMVMRILGDNPHISMTRYETKCPANTSKIALVVDQSDDYHFLRQDSNKYWSHKSGARPVTNMDAGKHKIWNPQLCDLNYSKDEGVLNYNIFCGYMCVPRNADLFLKTSNGGGRRRHGRSRKAHSTRRLPRK